MKLSWAAAGVVVGLSILVVEPLIRRYSLAVRWAVAGIWGGATAVVILIARAASDASFEAFLGTLLLTMGVSFTARHEDYRLLGVALAVSGAILLIGLFT